MRRAAPRSRFSGARRWCDPQAPGDGVALGVELGFGLFEDRKDLGGVSDEDPSGIGQADASSVGLEEAVSCLALEFCELLRNGRGCHVQGVGRTADRSLGRKGMERAESIEVER